MIWRDDRKSANFCLCMGGERRRRKGESTYHDMDLRRPDVDRFLTQDKKSPTSGRVRSEGQIREWEKNR